MSGIKRPIIKCGESNFYDHWRFFAVISFMIIMMLCSCEKKSSEEFFTIQYETYEITYRTIGKKRCIITKITGECPEEFYIPDAANGNIVYGIEGNSTCGSMENTKRLYLSDTIELIDDCTFQCCNLDYLYIGDKVRYLGWRFLESAYSLSEIEVSNNPLYESPENLCLIDKTSNTLILGTVSGYIPDNTEIIGNYAFGRRDITYIQIPDSVTKIENGAFDACELLKQVIYMPNSVSIMGEYAFSDSGITGLRGGNYTVIPSHMLSHCLSLTDFQIPGTVKEIESFFIDTIVCGENIPPELSLKELFIPATVEIIHKYAMPENITIYCEAEEQPKGWEENWANESNTIYWGQKRKE